MAARPRSGADLRDPAAPEQLVDAVEREFGPIDVLAANAGIGRLTPYEEVDAALFDETIAVNLRAPFLLARRVLPGMREGGFGRILFTSSVAALTGGIIGPHYAASKAGLHGLTHHLAVRVAGDGVTVNAIAPALIEQTGMLPGDPGNLAAAVPWDDSARPQRSRTWCWRCCATAYLTNQVVSIDGGMHPGLIARLPSRQACSPRYSDSSTRSLSSDWYSTCVSCSVVRQGLPSAPHVGPVLGRAGKLDVVGDHDRAGMQPALLEDALEVRQVGLLVVIDEDEVHRSLAESVLVPSRSIVAPPSPSVPTTTVSRSPMPAWSQMRRAIAALPALNSIEQSRAPAGMTPGHAQRAVAAVGAELEQQLRLRRGGPRASRISPFSSPTFIIKLWLQQNSSITRMASSRSPGRAFASTYSASASSRPSPTCQFSSRLRRFRAHAHDRPAQERKPPAPDLADAPHRSGTLNTRAMPGRPGRLQGKLRSLVLVP